MPAGLSVDDWFSWVHAGRGQGGSGAFVVVV